MLDEIRNKITATITAAGFTFGDFWGVTHREGMPNGITVRPETGVTADASETLLVTAETVQRYAIRSPWAHTHWHAVSPAKTYSTPEELIAVLKQESAGKRGCW